MTADPIWLAYARTLTGTREIVGPKHSPVIMGWIKKLGAKVLGVTVADDETPWCGTFVAHVMKQAGFSPPKIAVRASAWDAFGVPVSKMWLGAVVRFQRSGGGHVGFLTGVSADGKLLRVLGGNQSNSVNETWIERSRLVAMRWPDGLKTITPAPVLTAAGKVSKNEA